MSRREKAGVDRLSKKSSGSKPATCSQRTPAQQTFFIFICEVREDFLMGTLFGPLKTLFKTLRSRRATFCIASFTSRVYRFCRQPNPLVKEDHAVHICCHQPGRPGPESRIFLSTTPPPTQHSHYGGNLLSRKRSTQFYQPHRMESNLQKRVLLPCYECSIYECARSTCLQLLLRLALRLGGGELKLHFRSAQLGPGGIPVALSLSGGC